jgi:serine/threonine protein kinase
MGSDTESDALLNKVVSGYRLVECIGLGASSWVYRGIRVSESPREGETIIFPDEAAVKLFTVTGSSIQERARNRKRFLAEAEALKRLKHSNILPVISAGDDAASGRPYIIMPFMAGGSLMHLIAHKGALPLDQVDDILRQVAAALDFAHSAITTGDDKRPAIIHRDIKPANILLDLAGKPYLSDFGIARILSETMSLHTLSGGFMGTPAYVAPEQIRDASRVDARADIYGLGMVVYEMVTGHIAFQDSDLYSLLHRQVFETPISPHVARPDLPQPAAAAILKALAKAPEDRFPHAASFASAFSDGLKGIWTAGLKESSSSLAGAAHGHGVAKVKRTKPSGVRPAPALRNRRVLLVALVSCILLVALGAGVVSGQMNGLSIGNIRWLFPGHATATTFQPSPTSTSIPFAVTGVTTQVTPSAFDGACTSSMQYSSKAVVQILPRGPGGVLSYDWLDSNGQRSQVQTADIAPGATSQTISGTFSVSAATGNGATQWRRLEIVAPSSMRSTEGDFTLTCYVKIRAVTLSTTPAHLACRQTTYFTSRVTVTVDPGPTETFSYSWYGPPQEYYNIPNMNRSVTIPGGATTASAVRTDTVSPEELGYPYTEYAISVFGHGQNLGNTTYTYMDSNNPC